MKQIILRNCVHVIFYFQYCMHWNSFITTHIINSVFLYFCLECMFVPIHLFWWIGLDSSKLKSKHALNRLHFKVQTQKGTYQNYYWKEGFLVCDSLGYTLCFFPLYFGRIINFTTFSSFIKIMWQCCFWMHCMKWTTKLSHMTGKY